MGATQLSFLVFQLAWLAMMMWGLFVGLRRSACRWAILTLATIGLSTWIVAAVLQPLARNLTVCGGIGVMLGLLGAVDLCRRIIPLRAEHPAD